MVCRKLYKSSGDREYKYVRENKIYKHLFILCFKFLYLPLLYLINLRRLCEEYELITY